MAKILIYGDVHFEVHEDFDNVAKTCQWIADQIEEHKPRVVVCLGDLSHYHQYIDIEALHHLYRGLKLIACASSRQGSDHFVMSGNHDQCSKDRSLGILTVLEDLPHTTTVPDMKEVKTRVYLAYHRDLNEFKTRAMASAGPDKMLFMHQDFKGAAPAAEMVEPEWVAGYKIVFNGHVHKPQRIGNVVMVGSPLHHNFGDDPAEKRGCVLYDVDTGEVKWLENPHTDKYVTVTDADSEETIMLKAGVLGKPSPDRVCIRVMTSGTGDALTKRVERIKEMGYKSVKVVPAKGDEDPAIQRTFDLTTDPNDIIDRYLTSAKVNNRDGLAFQGKKIVEEAKG